MSADKYTITKLNSDNYFNWRFRVEMILKEKDLWHVISENRPSPITDIWKKQDEKAFATIVNTVEDSQLQHVRSCKTTKEAWGSLKEFHEKDSPGSRVRILRTIMNQRIDENGDIEQHVNKLNELFQKLLAHGDEIRPEFLMSATLLGSLPSSYDSLITALEARREDELTSSFVRSKIVDEYRRRKERNDSGGDSTALKVSTNKNGQNNNNNRLKTCVFCKKKGHIRSECRKFTKWLEEKRGKSEANMVDHESKSNGEILFMVGKVDGWILDSGATCHISCRKDNFVSLNDNHREKVSVANGNEVMSSGRGNVKIDFVNDDGTSTKVTMCDVLFVPDIGGNLISVKRLTEKGFKINFMNNKCEIRTEQNKQIAVGNIKDNLYKMSVKESINFVKNDYKKCIHDWHRILGHPDIEADQVILLMVIKWSIAMKNAKQCQIVRFVLKEKCRELNFLKNHKTDQKKHLN